MGHVDLLKRAFTITWRYRALWIFGFLLALCGGSGGGGGGGGNANFRFPSGGDGGDFGNLPDLPDISPTVIIAVVVGLVVLVLVLAVVGIIVRAVTRTALIGMVDRVEETTAVSMADGWQIGWSRRAWRVFLVNLLIGIPLTLVSIILILLALSPLLLLIANNTALTVIAVIATVLAVLAVILLLIAINAIVGPIQELTWRRTVLAERGPVDSLRDAVSLVRSRWKDVLVLWLLMVGVGIGWAVVSLVLLIPALLGAVLVGGIPAALVYLISRSGLGAAIAGVPLGLLVLILLMSAAAGLYLIYQSAVWTLGYRALQRPADGGRGPGVSSVADPGVAAGDSDAG